MPSVLDAVHVAPELSRGGWRVRVGGAEHRVREWTWGERRRLLASCVRDGSTLDRDAFVDGLVGLLVDPAPRPADRDLFAAVALRLCGVDPADRVASLLDAEARLARAWGWGPAELDHQPAPRVDEHLRAAAGGPAAAGGWTRIEVVDGGG